MAFGATTKTRRTKVTANIDKDDANSNQEAIPVPYCAGRNRIPVTWITPCYNRVAKKHSSGSGKASGSSVSYKYYVDLVTAICVCGRTPLVAISQIIIDHVVAWSGNVTRRAGHPYEAITVPQYGEMRIYWGQLDQPAVDWFPFHFDATKADDTFEAQEARTDNLPPYRGVALLVMHQFFMGDNRTQMPTVEVVVDRAPLWFADQAAPVVDERGSNVIALLYEWLVDDWFGVGFDAAKLVKTDWLAAYAAAQAAGHRLSPLITEANGFRTLVAQLLEYFDGYVRRAGSSLSVGFWRHGNTDTSALPAIDDTVLAGEPEMVSAGYGDTINQVSVSWRDSSRYFHASALPANSTGNLRIVGERRFESIDRAWIIDPGHAAAYAAEYLNLRSQPNYTGPIKVKREWIELHGVTPGSLVKLDSGAYGLEIICRITELGHGADREGAMDLTLESERGLYPSLYVPTPPARVADFSAVAAEVEHARAVTLPSGLKTTADAEIAVLVERPDATLTGFRVYLSRDGASYDPLASSTAFAERGMVATVYPADTAAIDAVGVTVALDGIDADLITSQSDAARDANTLLCWIDNEICSVGQVEALGSGHYRVALHRGLYATAQAAHFVGAAVWFILQQDLTRISATGTIEDGETIFLKLPTFNRQAEQAISDAFVLEYTIGTGSAVGAAFGLTLSTYAEAGVDGKIESRVQATWLNYTDQGIDLHEVAIKRADAGETAWDYRTLSLPVANWTVTPSTLYDVMIRPINDLGEPGPWSDVQTIVSASTSPFRITGLELTGQAHDLINEEPDFHFAWRLNSPSRAGAIGGDNGQPLTAGLADPAFSTFVVAVLDATTREEMWTDTTAAPSYAFTFDQNAKAFGTPHNSIIFRVAARDIYGGLGDWAELGPVTNPPPPAPTALSGVGSYKGGQVTWKLADAPDLDGAELLISATSNVGEATVYNVGLTEVKTFVGLDAGARFVWVREYDTFGSRSALTGPFVLYVGTVPASDIVGLSTKLSTQYPNTVVLEGIVWGNNAPAAGNISWTCPTPGPCLSWQGNKYVIASGSTALEFVWWKAGEASFRTSDFNPETDPAVAWNPLTCFQIARNYLHSGVAQQVWVFVANMTVGSFYALDAAIKHGVFAELIADEIDVIGTLQLQGQAVTIPAGAQGADFTWGGNWATAISLTVTSTGAPAKIDVGWGHSSGNLSAVRGDFRIVRVTDGTVLKQSDWSVRVGNTEMIAIFTMDPSTLAGTTTYALQIRNSDAAGTTFYTATARTPTLNYLETKR